MAYFLGIFLLALIGERATGLEGTPQIADLRLQEVVGGLEERYRTTRDLQANFTQVTSFAGFQKKVTSQGKVYLRLQEGRMRWDYTDPGRQQIFVKGEEVLYYVPEHRQVIRSRLSKQTDSQLPLRLLSGAGRLSQDFEVRWAEAAGEEPVRLDLTPRQRQGGVEKITLGLNPNDFLIRSIVLQEEGGNRTVFTFSNLRVNRGIALKMFVFKAPQGVEMIEAPP